MKIVNFFPILLIMFLCAEAKAQLTTTLNVNSNPSPKILEWAANPQTVIMTVTNTSTSVIDYKIKGSINKNGRVVIQTKVNQLPTKSIDANFTETFFVEDVIPSAAVDIIDTDLSNKVMQTGKISAGNYMLCVELVDPNNQNQILSIEQCRPFTVQDYQLPRLLSPLDDSDIAIDNPILFTWSPVSPPLSGVSYRFLIIELGIGQNVLTAFLNNNPIAEEVVLGQTSLLYDNSYPILEEGKKYIWSVQVIDEEENVIGDDNGFKGWAEPYRYGVLSINDEPEIEGESNESTSCDCDLESYSSKISLEQNEDNASKYTLSKLSMLKKFEKCKKYEHTVTQYINIDWGDGTIDSINYNQLHLSFSHVYDEEENLPDEICLDYEFRYYVGDGFGTKDTCIETICLELNSLTVNSCDVDVNFSKSKSDFAYTFIADIQPQNGSTIDSVSWLVDGEYLGNGDTLIHNFTRTRKYNVCLLTYVKNADGTACEKQKCKEVKLEGCTFEECNSDCSSISTKAYVADDVIHLCGGFSMVLTEDPTGSASSLSGKGKVYFPWLLTDVAVEFSGIKVNAQDFMCDGEIWAVKHEQAPTYPQQWGINVVMGFNWTEPLIRDIETWVKNTSDQDVDLYGQAQAQVHPVKVPLGVNNAEGYTLAFSAFQFTPTRNKFSAVAVVDVDFYDDHTLGFEATEITYTADGPINPFSNGGSGGLKIIAPKTIYYTTQNNTDNPEWFAIRFNQRGSGHWGTGINWTSTCGGKLDWCFRADVDFELPRKWFIPIPDNGNKVSTNVQTEICNWQDWIVTVDLPKCEITGSDGFELQVNDLTYDHSLVRNQSGMIFPPNYGMDATESFKGFWLKQAKLIFPDRFTTFADTTRRLETQLNNWVIHKKHGVTGELLGRNIINFPDGNIADLGASIDTIKLNMVNSSFTEAYMSGQLLLPLTDDSPSNAINYRALFGTGRQDSHEGFQFVMQPDGTLQSEFFAGADLEIYETSYLELNLRDAETTFDIELNGAIDLPDEINNPINNRGIPINFDTKFESLGMNYKKTSSGKTFKFDQGKWGFASPQKQLFRFPISIENFNPIMKTTQGTEVCRGGVSFDAVVNLANNRIGGRTTVEIIGAIDKPNGQRLQPRFREVNLSKIDVHADLAAIKMNGSIEFISDDPVWGDGVKGNIDAQFKTLNTSVSAAAFFGNTTYGSINRYRYWKVEAQAILPPPGIPFLPGVAFRGFGGGAYHHMKADYNAASLTLPSGSNRIENPVFTGARFTPNPSIGFGFKAKAIVATTPKEETFNADIGLSGEFASSGGMTFIRFDGDFWLGAGFQKRSEAVTYGNVFAQYDFPDKVFDMGVRVNINKDPITTPNGVGLALHIDGKNNKWFFKVGEPNNLNTVRVAGVNVQEYLMFGNDIYAPSNFMDKTRNGYKAATGYYPSINNGISSQTVNDNTTTGRGFAFGIGVNFDSGNKDKNILNGLSIRYRFTGGFEVNSSLMQYDPSYSCAGYNPVGLANGWRIKGNVAAYASSSVNLHVSCWPCRKRPRNFNLLRLGLGAWLSAEFPRPNYLAGGVDGHYNVLGGAIKGSFRANFQVGQRCGGVLLDGGSNFDQEDSAEEQRRQLISQLLPSNGTNLDTTTVFTVMYGFLPNTAFDAAELQNDGSIKNRTFQARYTAKLYESSAGNWTEVRLLEDVNSIGEYIYYHEPLRAITTNMDQGGLNTGLNLGGNSNGNLNTTPTNSASQNLEGMNIPPSNTSLGMSGNEGLSNGSDLPNGGYSGEDEFVNNESILKSATYYRFELEAKLYELVNGNWVIAKNNNGQEVAERKTVHFRTKGPVNIDNSNTNQNSSSGTPSMGF